MLPIVAMAILSGLAGGALNKARGGSFGKGALLGAGLGAGGAGLAGLLGAGAGAAGAAGAAGTAGSGATAAGAGAAGAAGTSTAAGTAAAGGMSSLLKQAAINTGMQTAAGMAMPQYGMTQVGNVPQMPQLDASTELQQLMQQSMAKKGRV